MAKHDISQEIAKLSHEKRAELFELLKKQQGQKKKEVLIPHYERSGNTSMLSFAQQRLWFLDQFEADHALYNVPEAFWLDGSLQIDILQQALNSIVARHEILRTTFPSIDGAPVQRIFEQGTFPLERIDLQDFPERERDQVSYQAAVAEAQRPFDLTQGPLMRATLYQLHGQKHLLLVVFHHIVVDGWSMRLFVRELTASYEAYCTQTPSPLPDLSLQCVDYALWQREWLKGEERQEQLRYWREHLTDIPLLQLPLDHPRPALQTHAGAVQSLHISRTQTEGLQRLSQQENCTLFMTLLAVFQLLLSSYAGQTDIPVGTLIANRNHTQIENLIGFFVNTLVLRAHLDYERSFRELMRQVREVTLEAYEYQDIPFEMLVDELQPERNLSISPLFQVLFVLQTTTLSQVQTGGLVLRPQDIPLGKAKVDLALEAVEDEQGIHCDLIYNTDLFEAATIVRLLQHFQGIIHMILAEPDRPLRTLQILSEAERKQMLETWNETQAEYPVERCLHELFEEQARRTPEQTVLLFQDEGLTYRELNERANQLAHYLRASGVKEDMLVGLCLDRSPSMVIGLLAILKAGGAYVPLDPEYPIERIRFVVQDAQLSVLLTQRQLEEKFSLQNVQVICVEAWEQEIASYPISNPERTTNAQQRAYVIYTSGSTGKPKGTQIRHTSVVNFLYAMCQHLPIGRGDRLLAVTTVAFDIAGLEIYLPLMVGGIIVLATRAVAMDGQQLCAFLTNSAITYMQATPSTWRMLIEAGWTGNPGLTILCGGEDLPRDLADQLISRCAVLWNVYGPTEATIWATIARLGSHETPITIGRPLANTQIYLLDHYQRPVPVNVPAELYIGGVGLSTGYLNLPALTAEKFIQHPFHPPSEARVYRTGDVARYRVDGSIEFLGRLDHQVKIRGYRIELGEIETILNEHPAIQSVVVLAKERENDSKRLVAYLICVSGREIRLQELRNYLKERLPEYMIPSSFQFLKAFPLTPNGKIDRSQLPDPDQNRPELNEAFVSPRDLKEEVLATIWSQILGLGQIGIHDNFFELGGDSLLAVRVIARANQAGYDLSVQQIFQHQTVAELAAAIGTSNILAEQGPVTGVTHFSPVQRWFLELNTPNRHYHGITVQLESVAPFNLPALREALQFILQYHDALRLRLIQCEGEWRQIIDDPGLDVALDELDLTHVAEDRLDGTFQDAVVKFQTSFHLAEGPLFKAMVVEFGTRRPQSLVIACHYISADLEAWHILMHDIDWAYQHALSGQGIVFPPKTTAFQQFTAHLAEFAQSEELAQEQAYWFSSARWQVPKLPLDVPGQSNTVGSREVVPIELSKEETQILYRDVLKAVNVQVDSVLLAALVDAFEIWTGKRLLLLNTLGHGRGNLFPDIDLSRTIGWISTLFPVLIDLAEIRAIDDELRAVNEQLRNVPQQGTGYGLLRYLREDDILRQRFKELPQAQIFFNFTGVRSYEFKQFRFVRPFGGYQNDLQANRPYLIGIECGTIEGQLRLKWEYSSNIHSRETIEQLAQRTLGRLQAIVAHYTRN
ncbi:MAG TPA: amino acid adenylation domain-containing protein [Ktedonosporobacter sp.]|nr:amino acid adenylation domain-containing protein [Ktedonosporobacter sp.]